jgi:hypothetical protein
MLDVYELLQNTKRTWEKIKSGGRLTEPDLFST